MVFALYKSVKPNGGFMIDYKLKDASTVELDMQGEITADDYKTIKPKLEQLFQERGRMKFLINVEKVKNFTLGAIYQDIKLDMQNLKYVGDTAIVGNKKAQEYLTKFIDMIFPAKVEFFEGNTEAAAWLKTV